MTRFSLAACTPLQRAILLALRGAGPGRVVTVAALADAVYGDRADGGPDWAEASIRSTVFLLRRRLAGGPVAICSRVGRSGGGYWLGGAASLRDAFDESAQRAREIPAAPLLTGDPTAGPDRIAARGGRRRDISPAGCAKNLGAGRASGLLQGNPVASAPAGGETPAHSFEAAL